MVFIEVEVGVSLTQLLQFFHLRWIRRRRTIKKGLTDLEWSTGIPGSLGDAIYNNAGAFNHSIKEIISKVKIFNVKNFKIKILKNSKCDFGYRQSIFKKHKVIGSRASEY